MVLARSLPFSSLKTPSPKKKKNNDEEKVDTDHI